MSVITVTIVRPREGKRGLIEDRVRRVGSIFARLGAEVRLSRIIAGPFTECIAIQRKYPDFTTATGTFKALGGDAEFAQWQEERDANPAGDPLVVRDIIRTVHGDTKWATHPVSHLRIYEISRDKLADAVAMFPEVEQMMAPVDVNVVGLVPITGENMSSLTVAYQFKSLDHWAEQLDGLGTSEAFQALLARAAKLGTIRQSGVMVPLED